MATRVPISSPYALHIDSVSGESGFFSDLLDHQVIAAQGVGIRFYMTQLFVTNDSGANGVVSIKDGATTIMQMRVSPNIVYTLSFPHPVRLSDNTALNAATTNASQSINVFASGYRSTT